MRTDPKNTRYVVESGARQKDEDWNPEENGGFAIHENDPSKAGPSDPLAQLEKTANQERRANEVGAPRLNALQELSEHHGADPYELSSKVRKRFREEKRAEKRKRDADEAVKEKYALPSDLKLVDSTEVEEEASRWKSDRRDWEARETAKRRRLSAEVGSSPSTSFRSTKTTSLASTLLRNTARKSDPFLASKKPHAQRLSINGISYKPK